MSNDPDDGKESRIRAKYEGLKSRIEKATSIEQINKLKNEIKQLSEEAGGLLSSELAALDLQLTNKETAVQNEAAKNLAKAETKQELEEGRREKAKDIYAKLDSFHEDLLKEERAQNKSLSSLISKMEKGEEIPKELLQELNKPVTEQLKEHWKDINKAHKTALEQENLANKALQGIEDRLKDKNISAAERQIQEARKAALEQDKVLAQQVKAKVELHYQQRQERAEAIQTGLKIANEPGGGMGKKVLEQQAKIFKEIHGKSHDQILSERDPASIKKNANLQEKIIKSSNSRGFVPDKTPIIQKPTDRAKKGGWAI